MAVTDVLGACPEPYSVAAEVMAEALLVVDDLRREMGSLLDDMVTLARAEGTRLPESDAAAVREDLHVMGHLRQRYGLGKLFAPETRDRCGRCAVPLLAVALIQVWQWVEYASEWLESVDGLRILVDARLGHRFSGDRRSD